VCTDERQYIPGAGQRWTTLEELRRTHRNAFQQLEPDLFGIGTTPAFAIGQRALLVRTPAGNVLWDCIALLDAATIEIITALGGLRAIAISHPHYYTSMVEWSRAFGDVPIYLHAADRQWVMRPDRAVTFWNGATHELLPGLRLVHCGGHFAGGTVLLWEAGAEGRGALLSGDIVQVVSDTRWVSFMRSYPNLIPLPPSEVQRIADIVGGLRFDRIYGAWWDLPDHKGYLVGRHTYKCEQ
jgi:glyoxylase-like metal-dependent hydrolase (beta-lactamase superfamily II)